MQALFVGAGESINTIKSIWNNTDANKFHESVGLGISSFGVSSSTKNLPFGESGGIILHLQRTKKGDNTSSQHVYQILFSFHKIYRRNGIGNGTSIDFTEWSIIS